MVLTQVRDYCGNYQEKKRKKKRTFTTIATHSASKPHINFYSVVAQTSVEAQKMSNILRYMHNKFQILTQTNKLLTYFRKYTSSDSHFILMTSCDVTGDGPMEAPIVEL